MLDGCNKALAKRVLTAAERVATFLNNVFGENGPSATLRQFLGGDENKSLLLRVLPANFYAEGTSVNPFLLKDGAPRPLQKLKEVAMLQSTIGLTRQFDASQNSAQQGGKPFCSFEHPPFISGGDRLNYCGPMLGRMLDVVIPALGDVLASAYSSMKTPADVEKAFKVKYKRRENRSFLFLNAQSDI